MSRRAAIVLAVGMVALLVAVILVRRSGEADSAGSGSATEQFFDEYVTPDGQVIRHDQGGDTVSEGQAYAMRLAVDAGERARFDTVWAWTKAHLQRPDGLFAWRWQNGAIVDDDPAADADFDIADALRVAADVFGDPSFSAESERIAGAVLDSETADADGHLVLVAGTWAVQDRVINPSYLAPCEYAEFATMTGDARWTDLSTGSLDLLRELIANGLPPDWVVLDDDGTSKPIAAPDDRNGEGRFGLDAYRVPARLIGCPAGRELAALMAPRVEALANDGGALAYSLDGKVLDNGSHPLGLIAGALTAKATGDDERAASLMKHAEKVERKQPTYYGAAWIALADDLLDGRSESATAAPSSPTAGGLPEPVAHVRGAGFRIDLKPIDLAAAPTTDAAAASAATTTSAPTSSPTTTIPTDTTPTPTSTATTVAAPATTRPPSATTTTSTGASAPSTSAAPPTTAPSVVATPTTSPTAPTDATSPSADASLPDTAVTDSTDATDSSTPTSDATGTSVAGATSGGSTSTTEPGVEPSRRHSSGAVDLDPAHPDIDEFIPGSRPSLHGETALEAQRQHTGAIALTGLIATTVVGAGFGLRERSIARKAQHAR